MSQIPLFGSRRRVREVIPHHCHVNGCQVPVPPKLLMCRRHWKLVPRRLQRAVWVHFNPAQCGPDVEARPLPTKKWHEAADAALRYVEKIEAPPPAPG